MRSIIELMDTIANLPSANPYMRDRARELSYSFRFPNGLYHWLRTGR